jgi:UDP-3-O-[3-hydroxymyristoyl] N-acetylglucosamine deacetylase
VIYFPFGIILAYKPSYEEYDIGKGMKYQTTIKKEVKCSGIGLHYGKRVNIRLLPASSNSGVIFKRTDLNNHTIAVDSTNLGNFDCATTLCCENIFVNTVEHFLASLYGLGIDNLLVEIDSDELPIMDGSAAPFTYLLHEAGLKRLQSKRSYIRIVKPLRVSENGSNIAILPSNTFKITYTIDFNHPLIKRQTYSLEINEKNFCEEIAPARTFGFLREVEILRKRGLARGGSLANAVIVSDSGLLNGGLRFRDEFVRHKILDAIGDISFLRNRVLGHVVAYKAGHKLHLDLVKKILKQKESWEIVKGKPDNRQTDYILHSIADLVPKS